VTAPLLERTRTPDHELPGEAELGFRDPFQDYQAAVARTARLDAAGGDQAGFALPAVLEAGEAHVLLQDWLARQWAGREALAFSVAPSQRQFEPGSLISLGDDPRDLVETYADDQEHNDKGSHHAERRGQAPLSKRKCG
jgi:hypothetical protein